MKWLKLVRYVKMETNQDLKLRHKLNNKSKYSKNKNSSTIWQPMKILSSVKFKLQKT